MFIDRSEQDEAKDLDKQLRSVTQARQRLEAQCESGQQEAVQLQSDLEARLHSLPAHAKREYTSLHSEVRRVASAALHDDQWSAWWTRCRCCRCGCLRVSSIKVSNIMQHCSVRCSGRLASCVVCYADAAASRRGGAAGSRCMRSASRREQRRGRHSAECKQAAGSELARDHREA